MKLMRSHLGNLFIFLLSLSVAYVALDFIVLKTNLAGGVGLDTLMLDEIRIRFLSATPGRDCKLNLTHLEPGCEVISHGHHVWLPGFTVTINTGGFRDREYPVHRGDDTYRILMLGDSFTFGEGVEIGEAYPQVLERMLNKDSKRQVEVLNLGIPGGGTAQELSILGRYRYYSPDLVVLQTLSNDMYECDTRFPSYEYLVALPVEERCVCVKTSLEGILELTEVLSANFLLYHIHDNPVDECFGPGEGYSYLRAGDFLDLRRYHLSRRDRHPNPQGHLKIAEELLPVIQALMEETSEVTS